MTLVAVCLGWHHFRTEEQRTVRALKNIGANVQFLRQSDGKLGASVVVDGLDSLPAYVFKLIARLDKHVPVHHVALSATNRATLPRESAKCLSELSQLQKLELCRIEFNVDELKLPDTLRVLALLDVKLGDPQVNCLKLPENLEVLDLSFNAITTFDSKGRFNKLHTLVLKGTKAKGLDGSALIRMPELKVLDLQATAVSDAGVGGLAHLNRLEMLDLSDTRVTDRAMDCIIQFPRLETIDVSDTKVTANGIKALANSKTLRHVYTFGSDVDARAVAKDLADCPLRVYSLARLENQETQFPP